MEELRNEEINEEVVENEQDGVITELYPDDEYEDEVESGSNAGAIAAGAIGATLIIGAGMAIKKFVVPKVKTGVSNWKAKREAKKAEKAQEVIDGDFTEVKTTEED